MYQGTIFYAIFYVFLCFLLNLFYIYTNFELYLQIYKHFYLKIDLFKLLVMVLGNKLFWIYFIYQEMLSGCFFDIMNPHVCDFSIYHFFQAVESPEHLFYQVKYLDLVNIHCLYVVHVVDKLIIVIFCVTSKCFI